VSWRAKSGPACTDGEKPGNGTGRVLYLPLARHTDNREQTPWKETIDTDNSGYSYSQVRPTTLWLLRFLLASLSGAVMLTVCFLTVLWILR
jgi:hypothetical protein